MIQKDMTFTIRTADRTELHPISQLLIEAYADFAAALGPVAWADMRQRLTQVTSLGESAHIFVAEAEAIELLLGTVAYFPPGTAQDDRFPADWAVIKLLGVRSQYRGKGIARRLMIACLEQARQDGVAIVGLHTSEWMTAAQQLYQRLGFQKKDKLSAIYGVWYWRYVLFLR
jgi:ribosomal protein S18 acetylase RimI-like enzyme